MSDSLGLPFEVDSSLSIDIGTSLPSLGVGEVASAVASVRATEETPAIAPGAGGQSSACRYNFEEDTNGRFVVIGFTVKNGSSLDGLPLGSQMYEKKLSEALADRIRELSNRDSNINDRDSMLGMYQPKQKAELTKDMLNDMGIQTAGPNITTDNTWPVDTEFLALPKGKLSNRDYQNKDFVTLNPVGLIDRLKRVILQRWETAVNDYFAKDGGVQEPLLSFSGEVQTNQDDDGRVAKRLKTLPVVPVAAEFTYGSMPPTYEKDNGKIITPERQLKGQELRDQVIVDAKKQFRTFKTPEDFVDDFDGGRVAGAMKRLRDAKPKNDTDAEGYAKVWALALDKDHQLMNNNSNSPVVDAANHLDADRKVCLEFLYHLYNHFWVEDDDCPNVDMIRKFDKDRRIMDMLNLLLVFDRAKALYFNERKVDGESRRGQDWYAKRDIGTPVPLVCADDEGTATATATAATTRQRHWGDDGTRPPINRRLVWFVDSYLKEQLNNGGEKDPWIRKLMKPALCPNKDGD